MAAKIKPLPAYDAIHRFFTTLRPSTTARLGTTSIRTRSLSGMGGGAAGSRGILNGKVMRPLGDKGSWGGVAARGGVAATRIGGERFVPFRRGVASCSSPNCPQHSTTPPRPQPPPPPSSSSAEPKALPPALRPPPPSTSLTKSLPSPTYLSSLPKSLRRLAAALPSPAGRPPSRDQLLALTTSFFERLRIRFKWLTIRSYRRFRADDYSAFFSFGILGTLGWFLLSTTSFFAFAFFLVNSLSSQEWLAKKLGDYMTAHTGVTVVFESAVVPKWGVFGGKDGSKIVFKNVYISRGPVKGELGVLPVLAEGGEEELSEEEQEWRETVAKWTHFHLSIDTVEISLSLGRWLDGKGLVKEASVKGVRGVVERSHIKYDPNALRDRFAYRHKPHPGDFWLESLQIEDFLVTIYQPDHFRPYTFSIFNADIRKFRKQWLFYDLMSAESITGQVDNCLFSLHKPQSIGRTSEEDLKDVSWARMSRFRVDGVPIDHMQSAHDTGVMSWVTSGRCDLVADIRFPRDESEIDLGKIVGGIVDEIGSHLQVGAVGGSESDKVGVMDKGARIPGRTTLSREALVVPEGWAVVESKEKEKERLEGELLTEEEMELHGKEVDEFDDKRVSIDLDIRFKDLKAHVPFFTSDISYVNNALIRPIVAFLNSNRTLIPIRCHIDLPLSEFNGSWTTYDVGLLDRMSEQTYAALAHHVQNANHQRLQTVSLWTLQLTAQGVLAAFKNQLAPY